MCTRSALRIDVRIIGLFCLPSCVCLLLTAALWSVRLVSCMFALSTRVTVKCLLCVHVATRASRLNIALDWPLMNACFISMCASETSQELLNNCRKVPRPIRLVCPPSVFTFLFLTITPLSVANDFSMWYLFFLISNLICCSKCKLLSFPSSWA